MRFTLHIAIKSTNTVLLSWGDSTITSRPEGRWVYTFFVILRDGKFEGGWYLIKVRNVTVIKVSMKYFCIIKERFHIWNV